jgi:FixJ family two-component response regulator
MSVRTAESHRASILNKLQVDSLGELVRIAIRDNVV